MCAQITKVSPLAPKGGFPDLPLVEGVRFASIGAGVKYADRDDVMLAALAPGTAIAGMFTTSATRAAPVLDCQSKLAAGHGTSDKGAAFLVNSGNANAFTGGAGQTSVEALTGAVAAQLSIPENRVYSASTGVIGEPLPHEKIVEKLRELSDGLDPARSEAAARAIMTTDTFPKGSYQQVDLGEETITVAGFAKGSGMIAPDMATMLVYIFTDARIAAPLLQETVATLTGRTFNCITVDSDTSTSDTLLVAATQKAGPEIKADSNALVMFRNVLNSVMRDLAHQVVRDGEGASKFIEVKVTGAADDADARKVALSIANSPLVKTAIAGEDPNWGRIVMAVGKSGARADRDLLSIHFGDVLVAENGWVAPTYREDDGALYMQRDAIVIHVDLGLGEGLATIWTCDLTHDYISINADYRS